MIIIYFLTLICTILYNFTILNIRDFMKNFEILFFALLLGSTTASFAQYGNYNSVTRYGGVDRDLAGDNNHAQAAPSAEEIEKNRNERIGKFIEKMKEGLTLDELQVIAIRNELVKNEKSIEIIIKKEDIPQEEKTEEIKAITGKTEIIIKSYLNKGQKEKYDVFMEEMKTNKKDKKSKKKEKEKSTDE